MRGKRNMFKKSFVPLLVLICLVAFRGEAPHALATTEKKNATQTPVQLLQKENNQLKKQVAEMKKNQEAEKDALRETLNASLYILEAMNGKDYATLSKASSSNVQVVKKANTLFFEEQGYDFSLTETRYHLSDIEYRFHQLENGRMTIGFAHYVEDGHITLYMDFIQEEGKWVLDFFATNK